MLDLEAGIRGEHGANGREQVRVGELFVISARGPQAEEADLFARLEPKNGLFEGGLFEVGPAAVWLRQPAGCRAGDNPPCR